MTKLKNASAKGVNNESRSIDFLNLRGFYAQRSAGSHGAIDVIGIFCDEHIPAFKTVMVQSKSNNSPTAQEMETLRLLAAQYKKYRGDEVLVCIFNWYHMERNPVITRVGEFKEQDEVIYI